ncbi:putative chromosome associated protein [Dunaliella salina]|uniref:Chromosome associated protein n=1 Tax=Dunaliella salina TaxID=3046 RepID=A0ABQ7G832_DUNSA|nr:putative chromosome associated protein [Dunaliella salina]|eukprot:KAF5830766.1 putative chromosome associated protein [Dunaliella salina]
MHIKTIDLCGFKSYKEASIAEPFSPGINVVVGANGAGKSNFFHGIRFVLNDAFTNMRAEERQQLLHEGAGHAVPQAYVEVVFDNTDGRFPVDRDEVRLRRTIGRNKDEYHLDRRHINKNEVSNLLESAGFSRANPYYIVQQGKIMAMSTMRDSERLELLKEIGGTRVYEERRRDSLKLMHDTESRRSQIEELLVSIDDKLTELDADRKELAEYQDLDRERRALEFALSDRELVNVRKQLEEAEAEGRRVREAAERARATASGGAGDSGTAEALDLELQQASVERDAARTALDRSKARHSKLTSSMAAAEADVADLELKVSRGAASAEQAQRQLQGPLAEQIRTAEERLAQTRQELDTAQAAMAAAQTQLDGAEARQQELLRKQGGQKQFSSQADRDKFLRSEIASLQAVIGDEERRQAEAAEKEREIQAKLEELGRAKGLQNQAASASEAAVTQIEGSLAQLRGARDAASNRRREAWRTEQDAAESMARLLEEQRKRRQANIPTEFGSDVVPLAKKIRHDPKFEKAVSQVFGRTALCRTMDVAIQAARGNDVDCVTIDGDQVSKRGAMTGGFHEGRVLRLEALRALKKVDMELAAAQSARAAAAEEAAQGESHVAAASDALMQAEAQRTRQRRVSQEARAELHRLSAEEAALKTQRQIADVIGPELRAATTAVTNAEAALERASQRASTLATDKEAATEAAARGVAAAADEAAALERLALQRATLTSKAENLTRRIRDLGTLPAEAFEAHKHKKVKHELDVAAHKIQELISTLDARKDEAIERTFKGVAKHFREVFADLVPGGRGELVMQKRHPTTGMAEGEEEGDDIQAGARDGKGALDKYSGVKRCDPAPFYLFDEIDAALDPQYRTTVARMLRKQANDQRNPAQFIITTFHPQIVGEADMVYGVAHTHRVSRVYAIQRQDALQFVQGGADDQAGPESTKDVPDIQGDAEAGGDQEDEEMLDV